MSWKAIFERMSFQPVTGNKRNTSMKKLWIYIAILTSLMTGFASCGDNEDFSSPHVLTADEIAEIKRQDSILEAQKHKINADLELDYAVEVPISSTDYAGTTLEIDLDKIATLFGITKEELLAGIAGETGAPEIKGFAISGTKNVDVGTATNTGGPWGHWWGKDSTVVDWGTTAMSFCEFNAETGIFSVGQYPGHLVDGQKLRAVECLKYNEKRVAVVINVTAKTPAAYVDPETPPAGNPTAVTQNITLSKAFSDDYASVQFDVKELLRDAFKKTTYQIHQAILSGDLKLYQGAVSETDPSYTADAPGYWLDANGGAIAYASGLVWCSIGHSETELFLFGGNHHSNAVAGNTVNTVLIATYNGGSATFNITFNITQP